MGSRFVNSQAAPRRPRYGRWALVAAAVLSVYLLVWTRGAEPTIGDEARHFRRAVNNFEAPWSDFPVTHDPAYPRTGPGSVPYFDPSLWHQTLALLWKALGRPSLLAAQVYHLGFFLVLVALTYWIGCDLYNNKAAGLWAAGLMASCPINLLLGTIFYMEIPMLAFLALAMGGLLRRWPGLVGLGLACAYLVKAPTAAVLIGPLLGATFLLIGTTWRERLARTVLVVAVMAVIMLPDTLWRVRHFGAPFMFHNYAPVYYPKCILDSLSRFPPPADSAIPTSIFNLAVLAKMLGPAGVGVILVGLVGGAALLVRWLVSGAAAARSGIRAAAEVLTSPGQAPALVLGLPVVVYGVTFATLLPGAYDVRYLQPVTLFGSLLAGGWLGGRAILTYAGRAQWLVRGLGWMLVAGLTFQAIAVPPVVHSQRDLGPEIEEAFQWIRRHTPPEARIQYLEENLTAATGRPIVWAALMPYVIFRIDEAEQMRILKYLDISYIAIHPTRRCDACEPLRVPIAYPRPWVRTLEGRPYLERVYPSGELGDTEGRFLLYRIDYDKVPREWLRPLEESPRVD